MDNVKKAFMPIAELLEEALELNPLVQLSDMMPELMKLMVTKVNKCSHREDDEGNVTHVFCYYHKEWEDITEHAYGPKASNKTTGLNTMCKVGSNQWTKQQRDAKKAKELLIDGISEGAIEPSELKDALADIERQRQAVIAISGSIEL